MCIKFSSVHMLTFWPNLLTDKTMGCCGTLGHIYLVVVNGLFMVSVDDSQKQYSIWYKKWKYQTIYGNNVMCLIAVNSSYWNYWNWTRTY